MLELEQAKAMTDRRDHALMAGDLESYLDLWADDLIDEGPHHDFVGKEPLRSAIAAALEAAVVLKMVTRSLAVEGDAMFYEFGMVWENRTTKARWLQTGMTYHEVDANGRWQACREYWDPADHPRSSTAKLPEIASLLAG